MRMVIQRVSNAQVAVDNKVVGEIARGALVFFAVQKDDKPESIVWMAQKLIHLRMFHNEQGKMHHSLLDLQGEVLIVSQFTLYGNCNGGRRPDFFAAAPPQIAEPIYENFIQEVKKHLKTVESGIFGADMQVSLTNDGPVTFVIDLPDDKNN